MSLQNGGHILLYESCSLDPLPTSVALDYVDILLPVITKIINLSLVSGQFAKEWKCALINPLLKKSGLDLLLSNYRPVSNLQYISKLTEKAVFNQICEGKDVTFLTGRQPREFQVSFGRAKIFLMRFRNDSYNKVRNFSQFRRSLLKRCVETLHRRLKNL